MATIKFRKYANRRLYNVDKSEYVTLPQVAELIRRGDSVEVADAKTGEDVTALILTQIVLEEAKQKNGLLPVTLLHTLIRYGDNLLVEFFEHYLQKSITNFFEYKNMIAVRYPYDKWFEMVEGLTGVARESLDGSRLYQELFGNLFVPKDKPGPGAKD